MKDMGKLCNSCDKPLSERWWLHLFHDDGKEEKIFCGEAPASSRHVAVYVDVRCKKGWKGRVSQGVQEELRARGLPIVVPKNTLPEVDDGGRVYTLDDLVIKRKGDRILMVLPGKI
jgi:hypothetical protein